MSALHIVPCALDARCEALRTQVRAFIAETLADRPPAERARNWSAASPAFSRALAARGWIGMVWPRRYGGHERSALERYVVMEELLAAGAPLAAHWIADRQSGPLLMRHAPDTLAPRIVPAIARGEAFFCIGMSEPDTGSDLASVRTRARRTASGWRLDGRKVWTSGAHFAHYMIALVRTGEAGEQRHSGLSQFLVDMAAPGITVRPIVDLLGIHDFNEVTFDGVELAPECLIGEEGGGWAQVVGELTLERSGPERYLSSTQLLLEMLDAAPAGSALHAQALGRLVAQYAALRQLSLGVAGMLGRGDDPALAAALVKDQGALLEQAIPELAHTLFGGEAPGGSALAQVMQHTTQAAVSYSLRGGTREVLRGVIARQLGLR